MSRSLPIAASLAALLLAAAACSSTPPAEQPANTSSSETETRAEPDQPEPDPGEATTQIEMGTVKKDDKDNTIPDDYSMLRGDCQMLGQKLGAVTRADYVAKIPANISDAKRAETEENINNVATKLGEQWTRMCLDSLVDKVVERERINCAMGSRTAKAFEECINPPEPKK
ncbi:MAG: hypothetical protein HUU21_09255 [Polyangiaceae bacterium]|nr:hypothetical protein [Polyangiaceae bacterium]NUQ73729.1 hypothetical protein [Polyangiaceae bacterium]